MARVKKSEIEATNSVKSAEEQAQFTIEVKDPLVNIRDIPSFESVVIKTALKGTKLKANSILNGFYRLVDGGYIVCEYCKVVKE